MKTKEEKKRMKEEKKRMAPIWHWGEPQAGMTIEECERFVRTVPCYERRFAYGRELRISIL